MILNGVAGVGCGEAKWKRSMAAVACWVGSDWAGLGKVGLGWVTLGYYNVVTLSEEHKSEHH